ncbi:MAG: phosphotriesterase [Solirubrobacteraceae bacterium]
MPQVQTTAGPVDAEQLGRTLIHEHLSVRAEPVVAQFPHLYDPEREYRQALEAARSVMEHGVRTIADPAVMDLGRDVRFSVRVAEETGLQVVMSTGVYGRHYTFLPHHFQQRDVDYLADALVHDIEQGIQGTSVKAGFLKCAVDEPGLTDDVEKVLRAVVRAHRRTGAPIMAHSHPATRRGLEIMDVFDDEGADPSRVQIAHTGDTDDLDYIEELLARGPFIGMDRYGLDMILPTDRRNATVVELVERGHAGRMMLSQDACAVFDWYPPEMVAEMAPNWSMTFLFEQVIPSLREAGVTQEQIDVMLEEAPRRWLAG